MPRPTMIQHPLMDALAALLLGHGLKVSFSDQFAVLMRGEDEVLMWWTPYLDDGTGENVPRHPDDGRIELTADEPPGSPGHALAATLLSEITALELAHRAAIEVNDYVLMVHDPALSHDPLELHTGTGWTAEYLE